MPRLLIIVSLAWIGASIGSAQDLTGEQWAEDLRFMAEQLESRHPNLYHTISKESFASGVESILARVKSLDDREIIAEMASLVATVGDGHTLVNVLWDRNLPFRRLPVVFERASDGLVILEAAPAHAELLGARVIRLGTMDADDALAAVRTLYSGDNKWTSLGATALLRVPEILDALGILESADSAEIEVEMADGERKTLTLVSAPRGSIGEMRSCCGDGLPLWLRDREGRYWLEALPDQRAVYVQFNGADADEGDETLVEFARRMEQTVNDLDAERLILDLRWNDGGARWRARFLLNAVIRVEGYFRNERSTRFRQPSGRVFTIIGPGTFSAATLFALDLDLHTNTLFVGEPTGGKPNHFGELGRFRLPHSGLEIRHSVFYQTASHPRDQREAIEPDVRVLPSIADFRAGRDPALEAVWGYRNP